MLSNPIYSSDFYYIGAFISEREKLIEDGYKNEVSKYNNNYVLIYTLGLGQLNGLRIIRHAHDTS
jgi:hypothetical protein